MKRLLVFTLKWLALLLAGLTVLAIALGLASRVALNIDFVREYAIKTAQEQVGKATGLTLKIKDLSGDIWSGLVIHGVDLSHRGQPFVQAKRVAVAPDFGDLLHGRINLVKVNISQPVFHYPVPHFWGGEGKKAEDSGGDPMPLLIGSIVVRDGVALPNGHWGPVGKVSKVNLQARLTLGPKGLTIAGDIAGAQAVLAGVKEQVKLNGPFKLDFSGITLEDTVITHPAGGLSLAGRVSWGDQVRLDFQGQGRVWAPARLGISSLPISPPETPLRVSFSMQGPIEKSQISLNLAGAGAFSLSGLFDLTGPDGNFQASLDGFDLVQWGVTDWPASGSGRLTGTFAEKSAGWQVKARARLYQVRIKSLSLLNTTIEAGLDGEAVTLKLLKADGPWGDLELSGRYHLGEGGFEAKSHFKKLTLAGGVAELLPASARRQAKGVSLTGGLSVVGNPRDFTWDLELADSRLREGLPLDKLSAQGRLVDYRPLLTGLAVRQDWLEATLQGRAEEKRYDLTLELARLKLSGLAKTLAVLGIKAPEGLAGEVKAKAKLKGAWDKPEVEGELTARGLALGGAVLGDLDLSLARRDGRQRAALSLLSPQGDVSLVLSGADLLRLPLAGTLSELTLAPKGCQAWRQTGQAALSISAQKVGLARLVLAQTGQTVTLAGSIPFAGEMAVNLTVADLNPAPFLPKGEAPVEARVNGQAMLAGPLSAPRVRLNARLSGRAWRDLPEVTAALAGELAGGRLKLTGQAKFLGGSVGLAADLGLFFSLSPFRLEPAADGHHLTAKIEDLPLEDLAIATPGLEEVKGLINARLTADGALDAPSFGGFLKLAGGSFIIEATRQRVEGVKAHFTLRDDEVRVVELLAPSGGEARLFGKVVLPFKGDGALNLHLLAKDLEVALGSWGRVAGQVDVTLGGTFKLPELKGTVTPLEAILRFGVLPEPGMEDVVVLKPDQEQPPVVEKEPRQEPLPPWLQGLRAGVMVDLSDGLEVTMKTGWVKLNGQLYVNKAPGKGFTYHRAITAQNGVLVFEGKRFELMRAKVDFRDKHSLNPDLSATARLRSGSTTVFINVYGTADDPDYHLSSSPAMSEADILRTIIFGQSTPGVSPTQGFSAQALAVLGRKGTEEWSRLVGRDLSPDVITVHDGSQGSSSLEAGKYLGPDLYLRYRQNMGPSGGQGVGLEYRISSMFSLDSEFGNTRDAGVDFFYRVNF